MKSVPYLTIMLCPCIPVRASSEFADLVQIVCLPQLLHTLVDGLRSCDSVLSTVSALAVILTGNSRFPTVCSMPSLSPRYLLSWV